MPAWSELRRFEIIRAGPGDSVSLPATTEKRKVIVVAGLVRPTRPDEAGRGVSIDVDPNEEFSCVVADSAVLVALEGTWGDETGKSGVFDPEDIPSPVEGDPAPYEKTTLFDNHYHDCDEYWVIVEGRGVGVSEGVQHELGPGDCLATRMGDHHDFPLVRERVTAVFFETTLRGRRRLGHLWTHTHGAPDRPPNR
jgi:mannose-6-phosphate isomerase-like protein (cupin superfamily)